MKHFPGISGRRVKETAGTVFFARLIRIYDMQEHESFKIQLSNILRQNEFIISKVGQSWKAREGGNLIEI